jgi:F-type H+-transporting ATPase subunit alpha
VFYLHSRLLERAARLSDANGGGSMSALPIIETQAGDISAYIPTNVISITDGQIYLDTEMFREGQRPAINGGLSVSRVGGAAQTQAMRKVSGKLRLESAQYNELKVFARFSSDVDQATAVMLSYGERLMGTLKQRNQQPLPTYAQIALLHAVTRKNVPADVTEEVFQRWKAQYPEFLASHYPEAVMTIERDGKLTDEADQTLTAAAQLWFREAGS